ncbi:MAG: acyclic terpene utilization AtuA family protein [Burkholderiaceae bacterium]
MSDSSTTAVGGPDVVGRRIRIGGAAGYWGDSNDAPRQLVQSGEIDYLVFDYLAEVTMSVLVRARQKDPEQGYARDFVDAVMAPLLPEIKQRGIRVIANAGGVNPAACAAALKAVAERAGLQLRIGVVEGDDVLPMIDDLRAVDTREMFTGKPLPARLISANAYLGAFPIAAALDAGAEVVITGRCVDSAVTLGPLIHEFGWNRDDYDKLAAGTLAGHLIECGAQATGGNFTDWHDTVEGWHDMGYPIAECAADGSFVITKPAGTGGQVSRLTVGEQMLYEIGDPAAYIVPDVICDFTQATLEPDGADRVLVTGVRGRPATDTYKVSSTYADGFRATSAAVITGFQAADKARAFTDALLRRTRQMFEAQQLGDYRAHAMHLIGAETLWGANASPHAHATRELVMRIDVRHDRREAIGIFAREVIGTALATATGRCAASETGRPKVTPVVAQFAFLIDKTRVPVRVRVEDEPVAIPGPRAHDGRASGASPSSMASAIDNAMRELEAPSVGDESLREMAAAAGGEDAMREMATSAVDAGRDAGQAGLVEVPLIALAVARSGDKGDSANIGVIARDPADLALLRRELTPGRVRQWFAHTCRGTALRYELPGLAALNFVLTESLGGGGTSSLHLDTQAKTYAQQLLAMPIRVTEAQATRLRWPGQNR